MNKDELLEEYRKLKLEEELNKAMWNKYTPIQVEITYTTCKSCSITLPVNLYRFEEFIKNELKEIVNESKEEMFVKKKI